MTFRQFDIDYYKLTIDGVEFQKPSYLSIKEWLDFWEQFDGESIAEKVQQAFDEGVKEGEHEHEKEIDGIKEVSIKELNKLQKLIKSVIFDHDLSNDDKYDKVADAVVASTDEIWRYG